MSRFGRLSVWTWIQIAVAVAAAVVSFEGSSSLLQLIFGLAFLVIVLGTAAAALAGAIVGPRAGLDLRVAVAFVLAFIAVIAAGSIYLGLHTKLKAFELVVAIAVLAAAMQVTAFALRRRSGEPTDRTAERVRVVRPGGLQIALGGLCAILVAVAVAVAVHSTRAADARHEFTALGIHPAHGRALPGHEAFSVNVISHETTTAEFVLRITAGTQRAVRKVTVDPGQTVTETIQVPKGTAISCTLARASSPNRVYRSVRIAATATKPSAGG